MDIAAQNLILDQQQKVWLLEWAYAGRYPVYFKTATVRRTDDPDDAGRSLLLLH